MGALAVDGGGAFELDFVASDHQSLRLTTVGVQADHFEVELGAASQHVGSPLALCDGSGVDHADESPFSDLCARRRHNLPTASPEAAQQVIRHDVLVCAVKQPPPLDHGMSATSIETARPVPVDSSAKPIRVEVTMPDWRR